MPSLGLASQWRTFDLGQSNRDVGSCPVSAYEGLETLSVMCSLILDGNFVRRFNTLGLVKLVTDIVEDNQDNTPIACIIIVPPCGSKRSYKTCVYENTILEKEP